MSLDVYLSKMELVRIYSSNITHNLKKMAEEAGIYMCLWHPQKIGITKASQLIVPLTKGIQLMKSDPDRFTKYNPENGWGSYLHFIPWIEIYLRECELNPEAEVSTSV